MKITSDDRIEIKYLFSTGMSQAAIAKTYGVTRQYVSLILKGSGLTNAPRKIIPMSAERRKELKDKAYRLVKSAIKAGLIKPSVCEVCGQQEMVHAHHDDYRFPLTIRWLCSRHHAAWHARNRAKP